MNYSTLLVSLLATPDAAPLLPLLETLLTHGRHFADQWEFVRYSHDQHLEYDLTSPPRRSSLDVPHAKP